MVRNFTDPQLEKLSDSLEQVLSEHQQAAMKGGMDTLMTAFVANIAKEFSRTMAAQMTDHVNEYVRGIGPLKIVVNDLPEVDIRGEVLHPKVPDVVSAMAAGEHVLLIGPAGSGKSHLAAQAAKLLKRDFHGYVSCTNGTSEAAFLGQLLPNEEGGFSYYSTPFVDTIQNGGVVCIDELDAGDSNTLLCLNAALSGQPLFLPKRFSRPVQPVHAEATVVATANTYGLGADRVFAGRNQLDAAFLDRWTQIEVGYDPTLEKTFCPDEDLRTLLQKIRAKVEANKMRRSITGRSLKRAYKQRKAMGWDDSKIIQHLTLGWTKDELKLAGVTS